MKKIELKKNDFIPSLVKMLMGLDKLETSLEVQFLIELINYSDNGYVVQSEVYESIKQSLKLTDVNFRKLIMKLQFQKHIRKDNGIIYINPKYNSLKNCSGKLLFEETKE